MARTSNVDAYIVKQGDLQSELSRLLADHILKLTDSARTLLSEALGISVEVRGTKLLRISPSRVGFGAIQDRNNTLEIVILPKVEIGTDAVFGLITLSANVPKIDPQKKLLL